MATDEEIAGIAAAALAWFDTEATFGTADAHTAAALDLLRERICQCSRQIHEIEIVEPDRPTLTVIPGDLE